MPNGRHVLDFARHIACWPWSIPRLKVNRWIDWVYITVLTICNEKIIIAPRASALKNKTKLEQCSHSSFSQFCFSTAAVRAYLQLFVESNRSTISKQTKMKNVVSVSIELGSRLSPTKGLSGFRQTPSVRHRRSSYPTRIRMLTSSMVPY